VSDDELGPPPFGGLQLPLSLSRGLPPPSQSRQLFDRLAGVPDGDAEQIRIQAQIFQWYLPLAEYLARRYANQATRSDIAQAAARAGLIKAVKRFDPARGVEFPQYAAPFIVAEITRELRERRQLRERQLRDRIFAPRGSREPGEFGPTPATAVPEQAAPPAQPAPPGQPAPAPPAQPAPAPPAQPASAPPAQPHPARPRAAPPWAAPPWAAPPAQAVSVPPAGAAPAAAEPGRYLVGELPSRVQAERELSLIVSITGQAPGPGLAAARLTGLHPGPQGTQITLVVGADTRLRALGELQQTLTVPPHGDSQPVRFAFRAARAGLARIRLTAWLGGTFLAELQLEVSVEPSEPRADSRRCAARIGALQADPGEVTLQVHWDGTRYSFQLLSQRYLFGPVLAKSLTEEPGRAVERTVAMLRKMAADVSGYTPALAARWVRETGTGLWQDLVPKTIQDQFWLLHSSITSFTIACADDAVPWELLYPLTPNDDAGFLVEQFPVLRRIYNQGRTHRIPIGEPRYVVPPGAPGNARDEVEAISRILARPAGPAITGLTDLLDLLDTGSTGLLHFACHNTFELGAGGSSITMTDGPFLPLLLNSAAGRRCLAARSPLVFINACRSAGASAELTQMMSWASQFMAAGAGAFLGTLWPVRSSRASLFAEAFYTALMSSEDLGQAMLTARRATRDDADPTWLAYTCYGDPAALAVSGAERR
jgi:hypothetical protein